MTEQWRPIIGYEGYYLVSDQGRVKSLDRTITLTGQYAGRVQVRKGRILRPTPVSRGYPSVELSKGNIQRRMLVHRIVAEAFIGPCPKGLECRHRDDVKTNNHLANLHYGTSSENKHDSVRNGLHHNASKTHCKRMHELTEANIKRRKDNPNVRQCRKCFNEQAKARRQHV